MGFGACRDDIDCPQGQNCQYSQFSLVDTGRTDDNGLGKLCFQKEYLYSGQQGRLRTEHMHPNCLIAV